MADKMNQHINPDKKIVIHPFSRRVRIGGDEVGEIEILAGDVVEIVHYDPGLVIVRTPSRRLLHLHMNEYKYVFGE